MVEKLQKIPVDIPGFDFITRGGLPKERLTLVAGPAGAGKTVFAIQYLVNGARRGEKGVFVSFEESVEDLKQNMAEFGFGLDELEAEGLLKFVDASPSEGDASLVTGDFDLSALSVRIADAASSIGATRLSIDSLAALFLQFQDTTLIRRELLRIAWEVGKLGVTTVMTAEKGPGDSIARFDVEEFVADNVIILRNRMLDERRRRTIEIFKVRGSDHMQGEIPFTITESGIVLLPVEEIVLGQASALERISTGIPGLDEMLGGGLLRDSISLVSGATGTGKTCLATHFVAAMEEDEKSVFFGYEESRDQLVRNAEGWDVRMAEIEKEGRIRIVTRYPEAMTLEDHLLELTRVVDEESPSRVAIDSLSALERITTPHHFREFLLHVTAFLKDREIPALITNTSAQLLGDASVTNHNVSTLTDTIIMLRYVEAGAMIRRGLVVLKMRGSKHAREIREFTVAGGGFQLGDHFSDLEGILSGRNC